MTSGTSRRLEHADLTTLEASLEVVALAIRYHEWLADQLGPHLRPPVLEIGSGLGTLALAMSRWHSPILASEPDPNLSELLRGRCRGHDRVTVVPGIFLPDVPVLDHVEPTTVVLANVLEHIREDVGALRAVRTELQSVSRTVLVVPAHTWAYSPLDRRLGHYRRYSREGLRAVVEESGWQCTEVGYFNPVGAVVWAISGRVLGRDTITEWQTETVERLLPVLRGANRILGGRWLGQSLIAVCER